MRITRTLMMLVFLLSCLTTRGEGGRFTLFPAELKSGHLADVYNFLETYLFQLDSMERRHQLKSYVLRENKFLFRKGTTATARSLDAGCRFSLHNVNDAYYEAIWRNECDSVVLNVAFPINFELITGRSKKQLERALADTLRSMPVDLHVPIIPAEIPTKKLSDGCLQSQPAEFYSIPQISNAFYLKQVDEETLLPIFQQEHLWYSAANLLQGYLLWASTHPLYVEQRLDNFNVDRYEVTLSQWINYCRQIHASVFVGLEEERADGVKVFCIAQCKPLGYKHMLSVMIPRDIITNHHIKLKAHLNAFIPMHSESKQPLNDSMK